MYVGVGSVLGSTSVGVGSVGVGSVGVGSVGVGSVGVIYICRAGAMKPDHFYTKHS